MNRLLLRDDQRERIQDFIPGKASDPGVTAKDNWLFVEAVLWIARTGAPWRDLPAEFGPWNSAYRRFSLAAKRDVWQRVFEVLADDADFEQVLLDATSYVPTSTRPVPKTSLHATTPDSSPSSVLGSCWPKCQHVLASWVSWLSSKLFGGRIKATAGRGQCGAGQGQPDMKGRALLSVGT